MKTTWKNWGQNQECFPKMILVPHSLEELQEQMRRAAREQVSVRPFGTRHAWSALIPSDGYLIDMTALTRHLGQGDDWMEVEAGMLTRDLNDHLRPAGLMLPSLTIFDGITIGGMVATGSHSSSLQHAALSDQVLEMTIVRPDGEAVRVTRLDLETWRAACLNLGLLGVVYSLRLKCVPARQMETRDMLMPLDEGLQQMATLAQEYDHVSAYTIPYNNTMWFYLAKQTDEPVNFTPARRAANYAWQYAWFLGLPFIMKSLAGVWPGVSHAALRSASGFLRETHDVRRSDHAFHYLATFPKLVDSEYVLPLEHAEAGYCFLLETIEAWAQQKRYPINMAFHARFIGGSAAYLSPTQGRMLNPTLRALFAL